MSTLVLGTIVMVQSKYYILERYLAFIGYT